MCGRYSLAADQMALSLAFPDFHIPDAFPKRYNIAPTQYVPAVLNTKNLSVDLLYWGLIPSWAKDPAIGNKLINARSETLTEKPSFKNAFRRRRCLLLADGFYEWRRLPDGKTKIPTRITLQNRAPFALAGLWEQWSHPGGSEIWSCTILTTEPNELMAPIHNRMPVILHPEDYSLWLDPRERSAADLMPLLGPYEAAAMTAYTVSTTVNNAANDSPVCIEPAFDNDLRLF